MASSSCLSGTGYAVCSGFAFVVAASGIPVTGMVCLGDFAHATVQLTRAQHAD